MLPLLQAIPVVAAVPAPVVVAILLVAVAALLLAVPSVVATSKTPQTPLRSAMFPVIFIDFP